MVDCDGGFYLEEVKMDGHALCHSELRSVMREFRSGQRPYERWCSILGSYIESDSSHVIDAPRQDLRTPDPVSYDTTEALYQVEPILRSDIFLMRYMEFIFHHQTRIEMNRYGYPVFVPEPHQIEFYRFEHRNIIRAQLNESYLKNRPFFRVSSPITESLRYASLQYVVYVLKQTRVGGITEILHQILSYLEVDDIQIDLDASSKLDQLIESVESAKRERWHTEFSAAVVGYLTVKFKYDEVPTAGYDGGLDEDD
jgi:hypothetical protein